MVNKSHKKNIQAIILAAGQSIRYGSDKTHILINNIPVPIQIALTLQTITHQTLIVVNEKNIVLQQSAKLHNIHSIINHNNDGIGSSISSAVKATADADGWLICLADMPYVKISTYKKIVSYLQNSEADKIILPKYRGSTGHPVGFNQNFYHSLTNKQGDTGARDIISQHLNQVDFIDVNDPCILQDIDTPQDRETLSNANPNMPLHTPSNK